MNISASVLLETTLHAVCEGMEDFGHASDSREFFDADYQPIAGILPFWRTPGNLVLKGEVKGFRVSGNERSAVQLL
jgi:hypothetical protein